MTSTSDATSTSTWPVSPKTRAWSDEERSPSSSGTSSGYASPDSEATTASGNGSAAATLVTCTTPTAVPAPAVRGLKGGIVRWISGGSSESGTVGPQE